MLKTSSNSNTSENKYHQTYGAKRLLKKKNTFQQNKNKTQKKKPKIAQRKNFSFALYKF